MKETPLISIITITYNAAKELEPTMLSVGEQDFRDFEHIIIDGASTDNTLSLARRLGGESLRVLSERDNGIYDAMNKGLGLARGKYLLFLNTGDSLHSRHTLEAFASACRHDADIIYGDTVIVDHLRHELRMRHKKVPRVLTPESWLKGMLICHQAFMVKKSIAPAYDLRWSLSSDYDWTLRCIKASNPERCVNLEQTVVDFLDEGATSRHHRKSLMERYKIMREHFGTAATLRAHSRFFFNAISPARLWKKK